MDFSIPSNVKMVRHAVAQHERRNNFELTSILPYKGYVDPTGRLIEKSFFGCHSDVGGGYKDNFLQREPLQWMYREARKAGIQLNKNALGIDNMQQTINGTGIHDSNYHYPWWALGLPAWMWEDHPILTQEQVNELEKTEREVFYYDSQRGRLRR